jgi:hypothetical protein
LTISFLFHFNLPPAVVPAPLQARQVFSCLSAKARKHKSPRRDGSEAFPFT